ncbi:MAG: terminase small subunit [Opitutaceae bacterium]|nr:terminase small subunit [Opitutaceae bacterium]
MIDLSVKITQTEFGAIVGISQPAVSDLVSRGVLTEGETAAVWLRESFGHLREVAAGRAAAGDLDLATERAGLAKAQREKIEMQNAVTRNELAPVYLIEEVLAKAGARVSKILDTIPGTIRRREPSLSAATIAEIARDVAKVRNIAAAITLEDLRADDEQSDNDTDEQEQEPTET